MKSCLNKFSRWIPLRRALEALTATPGVLNEYQELVTHLDRHHGWKHTVKTLKGINGVLKLSAIGHKPKDTTLPIWIKLDKVGIPKNMKLTRKLWKSGNIRIILLIFNIVQIFKVAPDHDLRTVESPGTGKLTQAYLKSFDTFVSKVFKIQTDIDQPSWHTSLKSGPNGSGAMITSSLDAIAIAMSPGSDFMFKKWCKELNLTSHLHRYNSMVKAANKDLNYPKDTMKLAKLAYLSDMAGKTRIVYILNYWFQDILHPLHKAMMLWLKNQYQDGTYDQIRAIDRVSQWCKEGKPLYSFDLTAATDRWPREHQKIVVEKFAGPVWGQIWWHILSNTPPYSPPHKRWAFYSIGQPMGAYASWAALAMTHHLLIRQIASQLGIKPEYVVLGDDVVIANSKIAEHYRKHLDILGVTISQGKSVIHKEGQDSAAEFAKQILVGDKNLSPMTPSYFDLVYGQRAYWFFDSLLVELNKRGIIDRIIVTHDNLLLSPPVNRLLKLIPQRKSLRAKALILLAYPYGSWAPIKDNPTVKPEGWVVYPNPWKGISEMTYATHFMDIMGEETMNKASKLIQLRDTVQRGDGSNIPSGYLLENENHPIWSVLDRLQGSILNICRSIVQNQASKEFEDVMMDTEFLEQLLTKGISYRQWMDRKTRTIKLKTSRCMKLHRMCTTPEPTFTVDDGDWW